MRRKNKTVWGVLGVILTIFGITFAIPSLVNKQTLLLIPSGILVVGGVILIAWAFSD